MGGWVCLWRSFVDWEWWDDHNVTRLFLCAILKANHAQASWKGETIRRGQFVATRRTLAASTGLSEQQVRTCVEKLESTGELERTALSGATLFTVVNYERFQANHEITNDQPTNNQRLTNGQPLTNRGKNSLNPGENSLFGSSEIGGATKEEPQNNQRLTSDQPRNNHEITTNNKRTMEQGNNQQLLTPSNAFDADRSFDLFWSVVSRKVGKEKARKAFRMAIERLVKEGRFASKVEAAAFVIERMERFASSPQARDEVKGKLHPTTWLNEGRYDDDERLWFEGSSGGVQKMMDDMNNQGFE